MWGGDDEEYNPPAAPMELTPLRSLRRLTGLPTGQQLVHSDVVPNVIRGIEQLGQNGSQEALRALLSALEQSGKASARDLRSRLTAVRVLGAHAAKENVRQYLVRELTAGVESSAQLQGLSQLLRGTAALALARSRHPQAVDALAAVVGSGTLPAEAALRGIRAYPLEAVDTLLDGKRKSATELAFLLADQGDLRAIERLREVLAGPDAMLRPSAAVGLARLGDATALKAVGEWLSPKNAPPGKLVTEDVRQLRAAAEVYLILDPKKATPIFASLLEKKGGNTLDAVRLALRAPSEALVAPLRSTALPLVAAQHRRLVLQAIGRMGGSAAAKELETLWHAPPRPKDAPKPVASPDGKPDPAVELSTSDRAVAAFALARIGDDEAKAVLERALARPEVLGTKAKDETKQVQVVRAALVRAVALRDAPSGLDSRLAEMIGSQSGTVRAVAYFGAVVRGLKSSEDLLKLACPAAFSDPVAPKGAKEPPCIVGLVGAVARGALVRGTDSLVPLQKILEWEDRRKPVGEVAASAVAIAAAPGLLAFSKGGELSTQRLASWAENGGPIAPLAARALATRDTEVSRPRIRRLLAGSDPVVRAHLALGLANDDKKSAASLLAEAYRFEDDPSVRRAILRALSRRREPQRLATLQIARDLDPDDGARAIARAALAGRALDHAAGFATEIAWVEGAGAASGELGARVVRSDGLALGLVTDPDGVMLLPGLPAGVGNVDLEPLPGAVDVARK